MVWHTPRPDRELEDVLAGTVLARDGNEGAGGVGEPRRLHLQPLIQLNYTSSCCNGAGARDFGVNMFHHVHLALTSSL